MSVSETGTPEPQPTSRIELPAGRPRAHSRSVDMPIRERPREAIRCAAAASHPLDGSSELVMHSWRPAVSAFHIWRS